MGRRCIRFVCVGMLVWSFFSISASGEKVGRSSIHPRVFLVSCGVSDPIDVSSMKVKVSAPYLGCRKAMKVRVVAWVRRLNGGTVSLCVSSRLVWMRIPLEDTPRAREVAAGLLKLLAAEKGVKTSGKVKFSSRLCIPLDIDGKKRMGGVMVAKTVPRSFFKAVEKPSPSARLVLKGEDLYWEVTGKEKRRSAMVQALSWSMKNETLGGHEDD